MSDVVAYHPVTEQQVTVAEESMLHLRASGWLLLDEHLGNQAQQAERDAKAAAKKDKE